MHFLDDSLLPENQQEIVIQVASYGPPWAAGDSEANASQTKYLLLAPGAEEAALRALRPAAPGASMEAIAKPRRAKPA